VGWPVAAGVAAGVVRVGKQLDVLERLDLGKRLWLGALQLRLVITALRETRRRFQRPTAQ
jgi:hypothetical protein